MNSEASNLNQTSHDPRPHAQDPLAADVLGAGEALLGLATSGDPLLARRLARLVQVVATEATKTQRFARALSKALDEPPTRTGGNSDRADTPRRGNRRSPGAFDPFVSFAERGEVGLREQLTSLNLEQLRDIVAEHGMDHDRLAMKWRDPQRVIDRIVDRVAARTSKGAAFRTKPND